MRPIAICTLLIALLFVSCQKHKVDNKSLSKILITAIDTSLYLDPALNEGDTMFLELPQGFSPKGIVCNSIFDNLNKKGKFKIVLSDLKSVIKNNPVSQDRPSIRNLCITVLEVKYKNRNTIVVVTRKYKGMLAADIIETIFRYDEGEWDCIESQITSAS